MASPITLNIAGPGPYGFRLYGGGSEPISVAKLRVKSTAYETGLREGDVIVSINQQSCEAMSHERAMNLLESPNLSLLVIRDASREAVHAAYGSLGGTVIEYSPDLTATTSGSDNVLAINKMSAGISTQSTGDSHLVTEVTDHEHSKQQFLLQSKDQPSYAIQQQHAEQFKNKTEIIVYRHVPHMPKAASPVQPPKPPSPVQVKPPSPVQVPRKSSLPPLEIPDDFDDLSNVTPTKGCTAVCLAYLPDDEGNKENKPFIPHNKEIKPFVPHNKEIKPFVPEPDYHRTQMEHDSWDKRFNVTKTPATPWVWQPHQQHRVQSKPMEDFQLEPTAAPDSSPAYDEIIARYAPGQQSDPHGVPLHLLKMLTNTEDAELNFLRKKKVYSDSMFYDEPEHKYPTIEEQIKMARRVALSLTDTNNARARGHRMFLTKQEKSQFWDINNPAYHREAPERDLYYNPKPWRASSPTTSKDHISSVQWIKKVEVPTAFKVQNFRSKKRPFKKFEVTERERKSAVRPGSVGARVSFRQSDELVNKRSKAGELFARRRAKSEEREALAPSFDVRKFEGSKVDLVRPVKLLSTSVGVVSEEPQVQCRLKEMIDEFETRPGPWDAGSSYSNIDVSAQSKSAPSNIGKIYTKRWSVQHSSSGPNADAKEFSQTITMRSQRGYGPVQFKSPALLDTEPATTSSVSQDIDTVENEDMGGGVSDF